MRASASSEIFLGRDGLLRKYGFALCMATLAGVGGSAATVALLALVNESLHSPGGATDAALGFAGLALLALAGRALSNALTNRVGQSVIRDLRLMLARRILAAPLDTVERYRTHRLMTVLTQDVDMVSGLCLSLPITAVAGAVVLGCVGWLVWLSWQMALLLLATMALSIAVQRVAQARATAGFDVARTHEDALHKAWRTLGDAAKELRLSRARRWHLFDGRIARHAQAIQQAEVRAGDAFSLAHEFGAALYFLLIGLVFLAARWWQVPNEVLGGFVLALLYMKGSLDQVLGALPYFARARVALDRVTALCEQFASAEGEHAPTRHDAQHTPLLRDAIELRGVRYGFEAAEGATPFVLGPLDLRVARGEILFIAGENGAGKTTLLKLLTGLYVPQQGQLLLDGMPVTDTTRDDFRQYFSPVLSDFHLFEELPKTHADDEQRDATARAGLQRLALAHKVALQDGVFSTTDLSTGQRKRLALLHAWAEARPIMVFDEWAADQDPAFRRQFYNEFLPELRAQGHTLVVISHDDRYFGIADRVLHMHDGGLRAADAAG